MTQASAPRDQNITSRSKTLATWTTDILATTAWLFALSKTLVFDVDLWILSWLPQSLSNWWTYRPIGLLVLISGLWWWLGNRKMALLATKVIFFPLILCFWKLPYFLFRQGSWNLLIASLEVLEAGGKAAGGALDALTNPWIVGPVLGRSGQRFDAVHAIFAIASGFKENLFTLTVLVLGGGLAMQAEMVFFKVFGIALLLLGLLWIYMQRVIGLIKPPAYYRWHSSLFTLARTRLGSMFRTPEQSEGKQYSDLSPEQSEKWLTNLQTSLLFRNTALFWSDKLTGYISSGVTTLSGIFIALTLVIQTVIVFALANYGLWRLDPLQFQTSNPTLPGFIFYSFNSLVFNYIPEIAPVGSVAKYVWMTQGCCALFITAIFISLLFSQKSARHVEEVSRAAEALRKEGTEMDGLIRVEYRFESMEAAISELRHLKTNFADFLVRLSGMIKR